jgi:hypothetical protein
MTISPQFDPAPGNMDCLRLELGKIAEVDD